MQCPYTLKSLSADVILSVRDRVLNTPKKQPYDWYEEALLQHYLSSRKGRCGQLLARHPIDDTKPSHHLTHLRSLATPANREPEVARELWLDSLPIPLQSTVKTLLKYSSLETAALVAARSLRMPVVRLTPSLPRN